MSLKARFVEHLIENQPDLLKNHSSDQIQSLISEQIISPFQVKLPKELLTKTHAEIKKYWPLRFWTHKHRSSEYPLSKDQLPKNYAVCMSYDFHFNREKNELELIEINTNSAFLALGIELYKFWKLKNQPFDFDEAALVAMFKNEVKLNSFQPYSSKMAIVDESPEQQRLFIEFLVYQAVLNKNGFQTDILDTSGISENSNYDLIYNRSTDFYLQNDKSKTLKNLFLNARTLSPNPWEYFLLADKQRLIDWNEQTEIEKPNSLLKTYDLGKSDKDQIWSERKSLFIKPKTSFGSKQSYRAGSISRKVFDEVFNAGFIAQQFSQPDEIEVEINREKQKMKYDLRCYAYQDQLQMIIARLYQGQTTNARTPGGGFACVVFE